MEQKPEAKLKMTPTTDIESDSLQVHVALSRERHEEISNRFDRVDARMEKMETQMEKGFDKIQKIILWTAGTMFFTMLTMYVSTMFGPAIISTLG